MEQELTTKKEKKDHEYNTISYYVKNPAQKKIFQYMCDKSRDVYNKTIFVYNVYKRYEFDILTYVDDDFDVVDAFKYYYDHYCDNVHSRVKEYLPNVYDIITKSGLFEQGTTHEIDLNMFNSIYVLGYDETLDKASLNEAVKDAYLTILNRVYYSTKFSMINKKPPKYNTSESFRRLIMDDYHPVYSKIRDLKAKLAVAKKSVNEKFAIRDFVYKVAIDDSGLMATMTNDIICKAYTGYDSYFALRNKGFKASKPGYLKPDELYVLPFSIRAFKQVDKSIRLTLTRDMIDQFDNLMNDQRIRPFGDRKYYYVEFERTTKKDDNWVKIKQNVYVHKSNIMDKCFTWVDNPIKDIPQYLEIISMFNGEFKVSVSYRKEKVAVKPTELESVMSCDVGVCNTFSCYDPNGVQRIFRANKMRSINKKYNHLLDRDRKLVDNKTYITREFEMKTVINEMIETFLSYYPHVSTFIMGWNIGIKSESNMGRNNNRRFHQIPHKLIIEKMKRKLEKQGKTVIYTEESYTSKCDALAMEQIKKHEEYKGHRIGRGLFSSSTDVLINADINGAINIMRKKIKLEDITGERLYNPIVVNF